MTENQTSWIYLDYAATAPMKSKTVEVMLPFFTQMYGNPSSVHAAGDAAKHAVQKARAQVAELLSCDRSEVHFTSGGTEADNWALRGVIMQASDGLLPVKMHSGSLYAHRPHLITTAIEHHAVLHTCQWLEEHGVSVTYLVPDADGLVSAQQVENAITPETLLVSVMMANNEVGVLEPIREMTKIAHAHGVLFHTDAVQAAGQVPLDVNELGVDLLSVSAHKLGGPKGIGCLYIRKDVQLSPLLFGGPQEREKRAGTENVPGIVGFGAAAEDARRALACPQYQAETELRDYLIRRVLTEVPGSSLNGHPARRLPGNASFCFDRIEGETLQTWLDLRGVCVSGGSACTSGSLEPSHVLLAMGVSREKARSAIRITLGRETTREQVDMAVDLLKEGVTQLRRQNPQSNPAGEAKNAQNAENV